MRILNLIPNLSGGGAERQLSYLAPELLHRGHDVHVAYLHSSGVPAIQGAGVHLHQLHSFSNYDPRILLQTYSLIKQIKPDVVQSWILQSDVCAAFAVKQSETLWVIRESNTPSLRRNQTVKFWLRKKIARWSSAVVANSLSGIAYWEKLYPSKHMCMIRNGFPIEDILLNRNIQFVFLPETKQETRYILFLGRFDPQKNVEMLLDAMWHIPSDIKLILCGSGKLEARYRRKIKSLHLEERIIMPGYLDKEKVWALMRKVRASVLVSHHEGFPNGLIEAMITKCPLVVSDIPPHREFLDETTACFVNKDNPRSIAEGILQTVNNPQGSAVKTDKAFNVAKQFSIKRMADEYEAFYNQLFRLHPIEYRTNNAGGTEMENGHI